MAVDFNAALGLMHASVEDAFGAEAAFRPLAGATVSGFKVEKREPQREFGLTNSKAVAADAILLVRVSALPRAPAKGDVFELGTQDWRVLTKATVEDDDGAIYTVKVERA